MFSETQEGPPAVSRLSSDDLDHLLDDNNKVILQNIADDLRAQLPLDAMLPSETTAHLKVWSNQITTVLEFKDLELSISDGQCLTSQMQQCARPTVHVDSFLYSDEQVDSLCEEGAMSRTYCLRCGSTQTAPLDFISHSFSAAELQFLFQNVLPDLSGRTLVDVGSRLGAVLYGGYVYSSASKLVGLELSGDFVQMQNDMLQKYQMTDRVQVLHADVCTQDVLLQNADVLIMNNVFEFFMEPSEQVRAWTFIMQNFRRAGCLLVTVPSLQESLNHLQIQLQPGWLEELPVDHNVYLGKDADPESLALIHLYRVM
uniref:Zgc:109986 n=1 Tax=Oryzias latipes TaxID=8090 RepID=H2M3M4_ORYLA